MAASALTRWRVTLVPYVLVDEDRLVAAILDTIEVPVLPVDPSDGRAVAATIEKWTGVAAADSRWDRRARLR